MTESCKMLGPSELRHAQLIAEAAHYGQFDKGGVPRASHAIHVGACFNDYQHRIVGYLHDVIEDSPLIFLQGIYDVFGKEVGAAVDAITRREGEKYFDYIFRCEQNPIARKVKIADIKHNMDKTRWPDMPESYEKREIKALAILEAKEQEHERD